MVRIHEAPDTATLDFSSTSGSTQQDETLGQAAFDLHLHDMPLEQEQQGAAGPPDAVVSADMEDRLDTANQKPEMKLVVISNRVAPFDPNKPQTGGLAAGLEPVVERSGAVWMGSRRTAATGASSRCRS